MNHGWAMPNFPGSFSVKLLATVLVMIRFCLSSPDFPEQDGNPFRKAIDFHSMDLREDDRRRSLLQESALGTAMAGMLRTSRAGTPGKSCRQDQQFEP